MWFNLFRPTPATEVPEVSPLEAARTQLEEAYQLFAYALEPRTIDQAIHLIKAGELRLTQVLRQEDTR